MIGHNNPPPVEAMALHVEDLFALVSGSTAAPVADDAQEAALADLLDQVRQTRKDADEKRAEEKAPHLEAGKAVDAAWKPILARCDAGVDAIKERLTPYREARQKAKDLAAQQAREQAEAEQAKAREALQTSDDLEARFAAEEQIERAAKLVASANKIDRSATGLRGKQIAEVTDHKALLIHIASHDQETLFAWLADYARKALPACLPGVTIRTEKRAA